MRVLALGLAACILLSPSINALEEKADNAKKIVGTWELTKTESPDLKDAKVTVVFAKDGKLRVTVEVKDMKVVMNGTYKVDGDKLKTTIKEGDKEQSETDTIKTLTEDKLVTVDKKKQTDEFKRVTKKKD